MSRKDRIDLKNTGITTIDEKKNITTGNNLPLRMTKFEMEQLEILTKKVQDAIPRKNINRSKVLRALVYIQDDRHIKKIVQSIMENV